MYIEKHFHKKICVIVPQFCHCTCTKIEGYINGQIIHENECFDCYEISSMHEESQAKCDPWFVPCSSFVCINRSPKAFNKSAKPFFLKDKMYHA